MDTKEETEKGYDGEDSGREYKDVGKGKGGENDIGCRWETEDVKVDSEQGEKYNSFQSIIRQEQAALVRLFH